MMLIMYQINLLNFYSTLYLLCVTNRQIEPRQVFQNDPEISKVKNCGIVLPVCTLGCHGF